MRRHRSRPNKVCSQALVVMFMACTIFAVAGCAPTVTKFSPTHGPVGISVTINGTNFASTAAGNTVKFNGVASTAVTAVSSAELKAVVPPGATTGKISVTTSGGTGTSAADFVVDSPPAEKKWTLMIYLDGDNNLEPEALTDFAEMAAVGSSNRLNIVVEMDRVPGFTSAAGNWTDTRRFLVTSGSTPADAPLQNMGELNMGSPAVLTDFVKWAATTYPADYYALVIWNHGSGWRVLQETVQTRVAKRVAAMRAAAPPESPPELPVDVIKAVAYDETSGDILYMKELQTALKTALAQTAVAKLDIVGFDACLMGMVEVAYALREVAGIMVASEQTEPGSGWPYTDILGPLVSNNPTSPTQLATLIVNEYADSYSAGAGITQSAVDVGKIEDIAVKFDAFAAKATSEWDKLKAARSSTFTYHTSDVPKSYWGADAWGFAEETRKGVTSADIKSAATDLRDALGGAVLAERHGTGCNGSHGLAVYFPPDLAKYQNDPEHTGYTDGNTFNPVDFVKYHNWDNWLQQFYTH